MHLCKCTNFYQNSMKVGGGFFFLLLFQQKTGGNSEDICIFV